MNNREFLNEALACSTCPSNFRIIYEDFCKYQELVWNTFQMFIGICNSAGIEYQLAFGTLLGAIRDNGQIPWDYDVDVFIHFEDRYKLLDFLENNLPKDYYYTCGELQDAEQFFIRIAPKGYNTDVLHVDVFYYVGLPDDPAEYNRHTAKIRDLVLSVEAKFLPLYGTKRNRLKMFICKAKYVFTSKKKIIEKLISTCVKYNSYTAPRCGNLNSKCGRWFYPTDYIRKTTQFMLQGVPVNIPENYAKILRQEFGKYMDYLPIEKRIEEVLKYYDHLKNRARLVQ